LCAASGAAQVAYVNSSVAPGVDGPVYLPSSPYPAGVPSPLGPIALPLFAGVAVPGPGLLGGHAINQVNGRIYSTDGFMLAVDVHPSYPALGGPVFPPFPIAGAVIPGAPITGLGFNSAAGILLMCAGGAWSFHAPVPPFPMIAGPFFFPVVAAAPFTGIGWDPNTASVWLCNAMGMIFNFTPAGLPIGPQPVAIVPGAGGLFPPLTGLDVNTSNGLGTFPPPFCSAQTPGAYHICVTNGFAIFDALAAANPPIPTGLAGPSYGLAFCSDTQFVASASPLNIATIGSTRPMHTGPGIVPLAITLTGAPPLQTAILAYDLCTGGPFPMPWGGALVLNPGTLATFVTATNFAGVADVPIPPAAPPGLQVTTQWIYGDPANPPFFLSHTNARELTIGGL
jgi:hypothetical protein